jgi:LPPG:FO 2-phospho-L-lactate transferase
MVILKVVELSGGVGGARLARGLDQVPGLDLTIVVNVGDDDDIHGLLVSADLDTVVYTLAGIEGPHGWGRAKDSFVTNDEMGRLGADNTFRLGDLDLAMNVLRTAALRNGETLSDFTRRISSSLGLLPNVVPASDDRIATTIITDAGEALPFQQYFVIRRTRDEVARLEYRGAERAQPSPGALESIRESDLVLIGPSNPPLSIWPILAIPGYRDALRQHSRVVAVSPLIGGKALKGPADRVMKTIGLEPGNAGVAQAYDGLIDTLIVDESDVADVGTVKGIDIVATDIRIPDAMASRRLASFLVDM